MVVRVLMPKGSDSMTEGKVLKWHKHEGEAVSHGDTLLEIETDKVDMEVEATGAGVLRKILVEEGKTVPVGELLAVVARPEEDIGAVLTASVSQPGVTAGAPAPATPSTQEVGPPKGGATPSRPAGPQAAPMAAATSVVPRQPTGAPPLGLQPHGRVRASPLARRIAEQAGIDLAEIRGTGPGGRIVRADVESVGGRTTTPRPSDRPPAVRPAAAAAGGVVAPTREVPPALPRPAPVSEGPEFRDEPLSSMRKTIATRLAQSLGPIPHFYLKIEIDMRGAKGLRESANLLDPELKLSYNDIIVKACAAALRLHPEVNASFKGDAIRYHNRVHIGVAVAVEEGGLITPVIRDCDRKTLQHISKEAKDLITRARHRKLQPQEYVGATFTVSNLGMMGIEEFSAVINPPESAILAVGAVVEKPVVAEGRIEIGTRCRITLSCDHRVVDGATGAKFLQTLQKILENPVYLAF